MTKQLVLLDRPASWELDTATRERGRLGIAACRAAVDATRPVPTSEPEAA